MLSDVSAAMREQLAGTGVAFLFVLARAGAVAAFLPLPWIRPATTPVRAFLALALTLVLLPGAAAGMKDPGRISFIHLASEAALGVAIGLAVAWLNDIVLIAMQIVSAQAGFSFASTIDPATQADSTVLQLLGQIMGGLVFVALGTDRELIRLVARSFEILPPGSFSIGSAYLPVVLDWAASALVFAVRLSLPLVVLLGLIDLVLSMTSRLQPQLQLMTLAFPAKILASIAVLATSAGIFVRILEQANVRALSVAASALAR